MTHACVTGHLTLALPPRLRGPPLRRPQAGAGDQQLRGIIAEDLAHVYFRDGGPHAQKLRIRREGSASRRVLR
ncbi:hypothetical protein [Streptomyces sp. NPDC006309]|uniref:hypothetical protein n=1 Tax=Streptomyces sp. NPDC006309 TaxID=3156749 RepID=UPI0033BC7996